MADLTTEYMGIQLKNPLIVGSCSLTTTLENLKKIEESGAGAVVLKSIFEEEILHEADDIIKEAEKNKLIYTRLSETLDYIDEHIKQERLTDYLQLIRDARKQILIPVIASINCVSDSEWISFAKRIEDAGADALELNISPNPSDINDSDSEKTIFDIIRKVRNSVKIPLAVKIGDCYTNLGLMLNKLSETGIAGMVLFNRFYAIDMDLNNFSLIPGKMHSAPEEHLKPLRWIALFSDKLKCSVAASTGIHTADAVIKQILAGADAVQIASILYLKGLDEINKLLSEIEEWMQSKGIFSLQQMKGKMSYKNTLNPAMYERLQFMKYYGRIGS